MKDQETAATDGDDKKAAKDFANNRMTGFDYAFLDYDKSTLAEGFEAGVIHERKRNMDLKSELSSLLAIIHRDGGHHEQKVGTVQAIKDAIVKIETDRNATKITGE